MTSKDYKRLSLPALMVIAGQESNPLVRELYCRLRDSVTEKRMLQRLTKELAKHVVRESVRA